MASKPQPSEVVEGATTGDVEDEVPLAKSAEDRKAAAAMSSLDAKGEDEGNAKNVDQEAVRAAMARLSVGNKAAEKKVEVKQEVRKVVKLDAADVGLVMEELDLTKPKATELLKRYDGNAVMAMTAFIQPTAA